MVAAELGRWRIRVEGRVQGVGFRWFTRTIACEIGVVGWVSNAPDGSVQAEAEGGLPQLDAFVARLRQGPPHARVDQVSVEPLAALGIEQSFEVRRFDRR